MILCVADVRHAARHLLHLWQGLRQPQHRHPPAQLCQEVGKSAGNKKILVAEATLEVTDHVSYSTNLI